LSQGELNPRVKKGWIGEESSGVVCREEMDGGGKFKEVTNNVITGI
jgi:hypothetical protein